MPSEAAGTSMTSVAQKMMRSLATGALRSGANPTQQRSVRQRPRHLRPTADRVADSAKGSIRTGGTAYSSRIWKVTVTTAWASFSMVDVS